MALFPPNFIEDLKSHADIVQVVQNAGAAPQRGHVEGALSVSWRENAVVPRQRR